jgi:hypothetical protein
MLFERMPDFLKEAFAAYSSHLSVPRRLFSPLLV